MRFEQVQRFILAKEIFWGYGHFKKPCLSNCLLKSIKEKNCCTKKFLKSPTPFNESSYKRYRNTLNHSLRHDKVPMWSVKESVNYISEPLTYIINLSINSGVVPDQIKRIGLWCSSLQIR